MKKLIIVGSNGMLGQELVKVFKKDKNYQVIAWTRRDLDITHKNEVIKKIGAVKPNAIINAAAYNAVDKCEESKKEFELAKKINGLAPGFLAKAAKKSQAIFVHYSTDYIFDGISTVNGFNENSKPNPINKYGQTKLLGEIETKKNTNEYYIIRLSWLFGKPALTKNAKQSFFNIMLELGKKNKVVKVTNNEIGCFTYAPDLAQKTKEIIDDKKPYGIYHITNSGACNRYEAVVELYKQARLKVKIIPVKSDEFPALAKRPLFSVLLNTKLKPLRSWQKALKEYLWNLKKRN